MPCLSGCWCQILLIQRSKNTFQDQFRKLEIWVSVISPRNWSEFWANRTENPFKDWKKGENVMFILKAKKEEYTDAEFYVFDPTVPFKPLGSLHGSGDFDSIGKTCHFQPDSIIATTKGNTKTFNGRLLWDPTKDTPCKWLVLRGIIQHKGKWQGFFTELRCGVKPKTWNDYISGKLPFSDTVENKGSEAGKRNTTSLLDNLLEGSSPNTTSTNLHNVQVLETNFNSTSYDSKNSENNSKVDKQVGKYFDLDFLKKPVDSKQTDKVISQSFNLGNTAKASQTTATSDQVVQAVEECDGSFGCFFAKLFE